MKLPNHSADRSYLSIISVAATPYTDSVREFDDITQIATQICNVPRAAIWIVDKSSQWFRSRFGSEPDSNLSPISLCSRLIQLGRETIVSPDIRADERFMRDPLANEEPYIRFFAGVPLTGQDDSVMGVLCVMHTEAWELSSGQLEALEAVARQLTDRIELQRTARRLREANKKLKDLSLTDELTGLFNYRGFLLHAEQQLKRFRTRRSSGSLWVMLADMDDLKTINDRYGHLEGSKAIKQAGEIIVNTFRDADIIARPGGDEFTAMMINTIDEVADRLRGRLQESLDSYNETSGKPYHLGLSVGLVKVNIDLDLSIDELVQRADEEMYRDKRSRKLLAA